MENPKSLHSLISGFLGLDFGASFMAFKMLSMSINLMACEVWGWFPIEKKGIYWVAGLASGRSLWVYWYTWTQILWLTKLNDAHVTHERLKTMFTTQE